MSEEDGNTLKLNLIKTCGSTGKCECIPKLDNIRATRVTDHPVKGFVKHTHVRTGERTFTLPQILGDNSVLPTTIPSVTKVEAYYGYQRPTRPLILAVTTGSSSSTPTYYKNPTGYKGENIGEGVWIQESITDNGGLIKKLDDFNCEYNNTIPIDLKDPKDLSRFYLESGGCLRSKEFTGLSSTEDVPDDYEVKTYEIKTPKTYVSRVAYGDHDTHMTIPTDSVTTIKVYTWKNDNKHERTPLLVAFDTDNKKVHYRKNLGTSKDNTDWTSANKTDRTQREGKDLTNLLNEARCSSFYTFKVELSKTLGQYQNNECSKDKLQVNDADLTKKFVNYKVYKHTYNGEEEFIITGFESTGGNFSAITYPIRNVEEVIVYMCEEEPLLVYINSSDPNISTKEWHKYNKKTKNWQVVGNVSLNPSSHDETLKLLDGIESPCAPPSVTIDINEKDKKEGYNDPGGSRKKIKVAKQDGKLGQDPPLNYDRYDHTVEGRDESYFSIKSFQYGDTHTIFTIDPSDKATSVSVYYWSHGGDIKGKPLLVKVEYLESKTDPRTKVYKWYENTGNSSDNTEWQKVIEPNNPTELSGTKLKNKLDLLNCRLNNVVIVDASKQPDNTYCHDDIKNKLDDGHKHKLQVLEDDSSKEKLATYKAYEHSLNGTIGNFHIVGIKNTGGTSITLDSKGTEGSPLKSVQKLIFYFCTKQDGKPLMVYYKNGSGNNWYKSDDGTSWRSLDWTDKAPSIETNNDIVDELDKIGNARNPCRPTEVTIDIKNLTKYGDVNVGHALVPGELNYTEYKHAPNYPNGRDYFTVKEVKYGVHNITTIANPPIYRVTSFSVYYWEHLKSSGNPLLIKIEKDGGDVDWYENKSQNANNTKWQEITEYKEELNDNGNLKSKLYYLNCKLNNVTEIDIGKKPTDPSGNTYCHGEDKSLGESPHPKLIKVEDVTKTLYTDGKLGNFVVYSHSLTEEARPKSLPPGTKFHISGFKNSNSGIRFKDGDSPTPSLYVPKVLVYFCDKGEKGSPLLIHFKNGKLPSGTPFTDEWYQTTKQGWIKVKDGVPKGENDIPSIYSILNNYATSCKDDTLLRILLGTAAGSAGGGATTYGVYEMIRWLFMSPWPRLM